MILFVTGEYPPDLGGVGDYTQQLRAGLSTLGCESDVLSRRDVGRWDARSLVHLVRRVPRRRIVHIQYQAAAFDLLGDVCLMPWVLHLARRRVRVVTTFHDVRVPYLFPKAGRLRWRAIELLAGSSDAVIAADERDLAALAHVSRRQYQVPIGSNVPCTVSRDYDRAAFRKALGIDDLAVVYFGLLNSSKGLDALLDAFELIVARRPHARLLVLGGSAGASDRTDVATSAWVSARLERLRANVIRPGSPPATVIRPGSLPHAVIRPGFLPAQELSVYLLAGDVALLPYADGASARRGSLLACAAHGLPIVSTLPAGRTVADAVLAVANDAAALADGVLRVAEEPELRVRLRAASSRLAARTTWPTIAHAHLAIYHELQRA